MYSLIGGILTLVVAVIGAFKSRMSSISVTLLVIASLFTLAGSFWSSANQKYFQEYVSGGDSYVYLEFKDLKDGFYQWNIKHDGKYPVYDVSFLIEDAYKSNGVDLRDLRERRKAMRNIEPIPVITKEMQKHIPGKDKLEGSKKLFFVKIEARNCSLKQTIRLQRLGENWKYAYLVFNRSENKPFLKHIENGYPLNSGGTVDWDFDIEGVPFEENDMLTH